MQNVPLDTATFRLRAKQCRRLAHSTNNEITRVRLLAIAADYDTLAKRTEPSSNEFKPIILAERLAHRRRSA